MKKHVWTVVRLVIAVAGVGYIAYALQWRDEGQVKGVVSTLRDADVARMLLGLALTGLIYPLLTLRWWVLMRARGLAVTFRNAMRLTMVGCFFNYYMVGTTGGDLVKVFYAAKGSGRRADAVMSILVDRAIGLLGLVGLAGIASVFVRDHAVAGRVLMYIVTLVVVGIIGALVYFSNAPRRMLRLDALLAKLPGGGLLVKVDQAALAYRHHLGALACSWLVALTMHVVLATAAIVAGYAMGADVPWTLLLAILPVLFICAAIPISPQGLGTTELLGQAMLVTSGLMTMNQMVGMLLLWRLYQVFYSMFGSLYLLKGDIRLHPEAGSA